MRTLDSTGLRTETCDIVDDTWCLKKSYIRTVEQVRHVDRAILARLT